MSFRAFIYYCALCGGCTALIGWSIGQTLTPLLANSADSTGEYLLEIGKQAFRGMLLGILVAFGIGILDGILSPGKGCLRLVGRIVVAVVVGCIGGLLGGAVGQALFGFFQVPVVFVFGWTITGLMIGAAPGTYDLLERILQRESLGGAIRKVIHGLIGGFLGGLVGGALNLGIMSICNSLFPEQAPQFWTPFAAGFVAVGMCIGLLIGTAQVVLKEAWLKIESGRRAGRELILSKPAITIGRAESCDIGLFGDPQVERKHARIILQGNRYLLQDEDTSAGTYLNGKRIDEVAPLHSGDVIRVGDCTLRFGERQKRPA
jgi:MFS family permease